MNINAPAFIIFLFCACVLLVFLLILIAHFLNLKGKREREKYFRDKYGKF